MAIELKLDQIAQELLEVWNAHEMDKILPFYTDNCLYEEDAIGVATRGKAQLKSYISSLFNDFPDFNLVKRNVFSTGSQLAWEGTWTGTFTHSSMPGMPPATGKQVSIPFAAVIETRDGKASRHSCYWDLMAFLQQAGLMPAAANKQ